MNPLTHEWVAKAEGDFRTAQRELSAPIEPNYDAVCFHAQQCAEKYIKARLQEAEIVVPKTHDLEDLLDLVLRVEPGWEPLRDELDALSDWAVETRYPGWFSKEPDAHDALEVARKVRAVARQALALPET